MMHIYHKTMSRQPQTEMDGKGEKKKIIALSFYPPLKAKNHNLNQRAISYLLYFRFEFETFYFLKSLYWILVSFYLITLSLNC